jgi:O-succinylbenzoic acid--CoA ligase
VTGNVIAAQLPTGEALLGVLDRVWSEGDTLLPLPWGAPDAVVQRVLTELRPHAIVRPDPDGAPRATRLDGGHPGPVGGGLVVVTSGSTGAPKGVELGRDSISAATSESLRALGCDDGQRWLTCLPLHHVAGLLTVLRTRTLGAEPVVHDHFDPGRIAAEPDVDWVSLVPTQLVRLLDLGVDVARFAGVLLGGGAPTPGLLDRAREAGAHVVTSYGMTETCGGCVYDGVPFERVDVDVRDDGRVRIRGPVVMHGYRGDPVLTDQVLRDGWFLTSDLGRLDDEGRLEVLGRADDVIVTGGENVSAREVAAAVAGLPTVADVHVLGVPHPEWGHEVTALVVPADPDDPPTLDTVRDGVADQLPAHARPRSLRVVPSLGRDAMGKVRRDVVARFLARD